MTIITIQVSKQALAKELPQQITVVCYFCRRLVPAPLTCGFYQVDEHIRPTDGKVCFPTEVINPLSAPLRIARAKRAIRRRRRSV